MLRWKRVNTCTYLLFVGGLGKKKTYDLNTHADPFLNRYASSPFPEAIEANEKELAEVRMYVPCLAATILLPRLLPPSVYVCGMCVQVSQREAAIRSRPDFGADSPAAGSIEGKGKDLSEAIG